MSDPTDKPTQPEFTADEVVRLRALINDPKIARILHEDVLPLVTAFLDFANQWKRWIGR